MKIKIKTIMSDYNQDTGLSKVTIATDLGQFTGYAKLHPEDKEIASNYAGCRYAEMRATIKYMKAKRRIAEYKLEPLNRIYNDLKSSKNFNENNKGVKILQKQIYLLEDEKESFKNNVRSLESALSLAIEERPKIIEQMKKRKESK